MPDGTELRTGFQDLAQDFTAPATLQDRTARRVSQRRVRRRASIATTVGIAVLGIALALPVIRDHDGDNDDSQPVTAGETDVMADGEWATMPASPLGARTTPATVWTGTEVLVWGGDPGLTDGAAYDPATGRWRALALAPSSGTYTVAEWTGTEMLLWGSTAGPAEEPTADGLAYSPATDTWRVLPDAPIPSRPYASGVWTGSELLVWGGYDVSADGYVTGADDGAAYDPATDTWRALPGAPLDGRYYQQAVWTGDRMLVWGGSVGDGAVSTSFSDGSDYDPVADIWRALPPSPFAGRITATTQWTGDELIIWGGSGEGGDPLYDGARLNLATGAWTRMAAAPQGLRNLDAPVGTWTRGALIILGEHEGTTEGWSYTPADDSWQRLPDAPGNGRAEDGAVWTGQSLILWGGSRWTPAPCANRTVLDTADMDGDGQDDQIFEDWVDERGDHTGPGEGRYQLGVCTEGGAMSTITGDGNGEAFLIRDVDDDGRDELVYGGTGMHSTYLHIATLVGGDLRTVLLNGTPLDIQEGVLTIAGGEGGPPIEVAAYGCEDVVPGGERELVLVRAFFDIQGNLAQWNKDAYALDGAVARLVQSEDGTQQEGRVEPVAYTAGLTKPCTPPPAPSD